MRGSLGQVPAPADFDAGGADGDWSSIVGRLESIVASYPERAAVVESSQTLSYQAVNRAANRVAHAVLAGPPDRQLPVVILHDRGARAIVALLGVLKAGRPLVVLDPTMPPDRIRELVDDAGPGNLIAAREHIETARQVATRSSIRILCPDDLDTEYPDTDPGVPCEPESILGIFYTSGSTGDPKGVMYTHGGAIELLRIQHAVHKVGPTDRVCLSTSLGMAASFVAVLSTLAHGAALCLFDLTRGSPEEFAGWLASQQITVLRLSPSVYRVVFEKLQTGVRLPALRCLRLPGEAATPADFELFKAHTTTGCQLMIALGATECGWIASCIFDRDSKIEGDVLPVGVPPAGIDVALVGHDGKPVPTGAVGLLNVTGRAVAAGYWHKPELTAAHFSAVPDRPGVRSFRSQDRARWRPDGMLEFMGRDDSTVKVRGQRVDLGEVERRLRSHPALRDAVVVQVQSRTRQDLRQLAAYVVLRAGQPVLKASDFRKYMRQLLPEYMIPSHFVILDELPLLAAGKVDRQALPEPPEREAVKADELAADEAEQRLVEIWETALKTDRIGVDDDYFELGGDSLSVLSMLLEVERKLGRRVPPEFFEEPTIRNLAALLHEAESTPGHRAGEFKVRRRGRGSVGLFGRLKGQVRYVRHRVYAFRRMHDRTYYFEALLAPLLLRLSFVRAVEFAERLARVRLVRAGVYRDKRRLFSGFLESLGLSGSGERRPFHANLAANLVMKLEQGRPPFDRAHSRLRRERQQLEAQASSRRDDQHFPIAGLQHIETAQRLGRGVILTTFHGTPLHRSAMRSLARRLGVQSIQTVSQHFPLKEYNPGRKGEDVSRTPGMRGALQAEIAFHGQQLLRQGALIHVAPDVRSDMEGTYPVKIGDRVYAMKRGVAELALNTGAPVVPIAGRFVDAGRILIEVFPALDPGTGSREQQIQNLLRGYGDWVTATCRRFPETVMWRKIENHLRWPRAE